MIDIDFTLAVALYATISIAALLFAWTFGRRERTRHLTLEEKFIWHCGVCTYTYINTKEEIISVCPRCGNYNKK